MVSKNQIKLITSLQQKKFRKQEQLFFAEGVKVVTELLKSHYELDHLFCTTDMFPTVPISKKTVVSESDFKKISCLTTPQSCLAVFKIPLENILSHSGLVVALDDIRDPGNLGTIIRLCDWFGINQIVCSESSVDVFNPKVVQATMGSISRVQVFYTNLNDYLEETKLPVFGTFMEGENIYKKELPANGIIVFGNEANGISEKIEKFVTQKIAIPRFGNLQVTESLNVATATAIVLSEFKRGSEY
jgi:RNA methyltransferase, TrmH family